jgi:hypothetical protein
MIKWWSTSDAAVFSRARLGMASLEEDFSSI